MTDWANEDDLQVDTASLASKITDSGWSLVQYGEFFGLSHPVCM